MIYIDCGVSAGNIVCLGLWIVCSCVSCVDWINNVYIHMLHWLCFDYVVHLVWVLSMVDSVTMVYRMYFVCACRARCV